MKSLILVCTAIISLSSCVKSSTSNTRECDDLKAGLMTNNESEVRVAIESFISQMDSPTYTEQNLAQLNSLIVSNCSVVSTIECFDCIKTLPSATEIHITIGNTGIGITKVIDLSYDNSNRVVFRNLHE